MMIKELWELTRVLVEFPVGLRYDDHCVAVVYERYRTISSGAIVRWSQSYCSLQEL